MDWEAIGAVGEVVGAAGVVITLAFLIVQLRQNTVALRQQSARGSTSSLQQVALAMMQPAVAQTISKAYAESDPQLGVSQMAQLEGFCLAYLLVLQQDFLDAGSGLQPASLWETRRLILHAIFISHWVRRWWRTIGHSYFTPQFREIIEHVLSEDSHKGDYWKRVSPSS